MVSQGKSEDHDPMTLLYALTIVFCPHNSLKMLFFVSKWLSKPNEGLEAISSQVFLCNLF